MQIKNSISLFLLNINFK